MGYGLRLIGTESVELCDECGFDARQVRDLVPELVAVLSALSEQRHRPHHDDSPAEGVYSGAQYAEHTVMVTNVLLDLVEQSVAIAPSAAAVDLPDAVRRLTATTARLGPEGWDCPVDMGEGMVVPVRLVLTHLLHDASHHLWDVRRGIARISLERGEDLYTFR